MIEAILVDDEPKLTEVLRIKLEEHCPDVKVLAVAEDIKTAYEKINSLKPKLVFLDIAMPGGNGFSLLDKFDKIDFEIIFVTGYNEYAMDALKVSAIDYLLKPVRTQDLIRAVEKAKSRLDNKDMARKYEIFKQNLNHPGDQESKITIPSSDAYEFVQVKNIIRCEGWQKYTKIMLTTGQVMVSSYNIGVFKEMLEDYGFCSCHKSHLVNKKHIVKYLKEGSVVMTDDSIVPVSRRKREQFLSQLIK